MAPNDPKNPTRPSPSTEDEAGIHKDREAISENEAQTPTRREPLAESDRTDRKAPTPASAPAHDPRSS